MTRAPSRPQTPNPTATAPSLPNVGRQWVQRKNAAKVVHSKPWRRLHGRPLAHPSFLDTVQRSTELKTAPPVPKAHPQLMAADPESTQAGLREGRLIGARLLGPPLATLWARSRNPPIH